MGGKRSAKNAKRARARKEARARQRQRTAASSGRRNNLTDSGMTMTIEAGDATMMFTLTEAQENLSADTVAVTAVPVEDTIHPYPLNFDPPLEELAAAETKGFRRHWEKLTYAFGLPDPRDFPQLPLEEEDREILRRYVEQCRHLAGYTVISDDGRLAMSSDGPGNWQIQADLPSREAFGGTAVAFRQIHNPGEEASFSRVKGRMFKASSQLEEEQQREVRAVMSRWADARGELMNRLLPTIVCQKVSKAPPGHAISFRDIKPEELFLAFNYGDTIHWGEHKQQLVKLLATPGNEAYYRYALVAAILGLSHLYFGWSLLVQAALGEA